VLVYHSQYLKPIHLTGTFAAAIASLQTATPHTVRLAQIERAYPQLKGLSQCGAFQPSPRHLLLGESLGMLFVELTSRCNERCLHCYAESDPERNDFLTLEEIKQVLQQARQLGRPFVQLTGGDPLIHRNLLDIVAYTHALDFQGIEIYTNGLLLTDRLLEQLKPYTPRFSFSIYADDAAIHDHITRVAGSWKRTLSAMERAVTQGFDMRAGVVVMRENADAVVGIPQLLHDRLGLAERNIRFDPVNSVGRGSVTALPAHIQISPSHAEVGDVRRGKLCVAANGDLYPCIFARHTRLGNIREKSLPVMMNELAYVKGTQDMMQRRQKCGEMLSCSDCQMVACLLKSCDAV